MAWPTDRGRPQQAWGSPGFADVEQIFWGGFLRGGGTLQAAPVRTTYAQTDYWGGERRPEGEGMEWTY